MAPKERKEPKPPRGLGAISDFEVDQRSMGHYLKSSPELAAWVQLSAEEVAVAARGIIAAEAYETGALLASVNVEKADLRDRLGFAVTADDPAAAPRQFGNERVSTPEEYLTRAAAAAGLDVRGAE
jgi:hypothetical protein